MNHVLYEIDLCWLQMRIIKSREEYVIKAESYFVCQLCSYIFSVLSVVVVKPKSD